MKYVDKTFTLPANTSKISQKEWDRIFNEADNKEFVRGRQGRRADSNK
jgi:hypothetical protein